MRRRDSKNVKRVGCMREMVEATSGCAGAISQANDCE